MTKEEKTQSAIATVITGMFAVSMGFVVYRVITKAMNEPNVVEETLMAGGGSWCDCSRYNTGNTNKGWCKTNCRSCCGEPMPLSRG